MAGIVLLSGGLDSTVALALFLEREGSVQMALTFAYGQRATEKEIAAARRIAAHYGLAHRVIALPFLEEQTRTALVNREANLPCLDWAELDDMGHAQQSANSVWVPNRNGLFLNVAAVFAENLGEPCSLITGFNREEAATFADNSEEFMEAINRSLAYSTLEKVTVVSPTARLTKAEIVQEGLRLGVPLRYVWSCYEDGERLCGVCESCRRLKRALLAQDAREVVEEIFDR